MNALAIFTEALVLAPTLSIAAGNEDPAYEKLLAVCVGIQNAGDCARAIEVWRLTRGKLHLEAKMEPNFSACLIKDVKWLSEIAVYSQANEVRAARYASLAGSRSGMPMGTGSRHDA